MHTIILVIHVIIAVALVCVILMQRSEGGALGGLGGGNMGNFMTGRSVGNLLTRTTAILATCFMITSITLAIMSKGEAAKTQKSFMDAPAAVVETVKVPKKEEKKDKKPVAPSAPSVPVKTK